MGKVYIIFTEVISVPSEKVQQMKQAVLPVVISIGYYQKFFFRFHVSDGCHGFIRRGVRPGCEPSRFSTFST